MFLYHFSPFLLKRTQFAQHVLRSLRQHRKVQQVSKSGLVGFSWSSWFTFSSRCSKLYNRSWFFIQGNPVLRMLRVKFLSKCSIFWQIWGKNVIGFHFILPNNFSLLNHFPNLCIFAMLEVWDFASYLNIFLEPSRMC